jgi:hypothetical protein
MKKAIRSRAQRREAFVALAGEAFDELERWYEERRGASFEEIEAKGREVRRELMGRGLEVLINQRSQASEDLPPRCGKCGWEMRLQDRRPKRVEGLEGCTTVERNYYVCSQGCGETAFPPGSGVEVKV